MSRSIEENYHAVADLAERKGVKLLFKSESKLMKVISKLLFWMSDERFMDGFTTTLGRNIYLADRYTKMPEPSASETATISHELVHVEQFERNGNLWMSLQYLFPQWLGLGAFLALGAIWGSLWWLMALVCLVFLTPIPAPWRMIHELEAYAVGYATWHWVHGKECPSLTQEQVRKRLAGYVTQFTGWSYYKMWPFREDIEARLTRKLIDLQLHDWGRLPLVAEEVYKATLGASKKS
jgi:hypothetical protein